MDQVTQNREYMRAVEMIDAKIADLSKATEALRDELHPALRPTTPTIKQPEDDTEVATETRCPIIIELARLSDRLDTPMNTLADIRARLAI